MSKLYLSENGRVVPTLCEELTTYRRARKLLHLPPTSGPGVLHLLARRKIILARRRGRRVSDAMPPAERR